MKKQVWAAVVVATALLPAVLLLTGAILTCECAVSEQFVNGALLWFMYVGVVGMALVMAAE